MVNRVFPCLIWRFLKYSPSNKYGKYHYISPGLLDTIPSIRYGDGNFLIAGDGKIKLMDFPEKNNASYRVWRVILQEDEIKKLNSA